MGQLWTLERLIDRLQHVVNHASDLTDQAFAGPSGDPDKHFRDALNEAYDDEVEEAKQMSDPRWFQARMQFTWTSGTASLTLPEQLQLAVIERLADVTDGYPGQTLWVGDWPQTAQHHWRDRHTLVWGSTGPASDRTIEATYRASPEELLQDTDQPTLIDNKFRHLLVWSAAIIMLVTADLTAPGEWYTRREEIRMRWHKALSQGKPTATGFNGIRNTDQDFFGPFP